MTDPNNYFATLKPGVTVFSVEAAAREIFRMKAPTARDLSKVRAAMMASSARHIRRKRDGEMVDFWSVER